MSLYGVIGYHVTYKETLVPHLVAALIYLSQNYSYYIRGDRVPESPNSRSYWQTIWHSPSKHYTLTQCQCNFGPSSPTGGATFHIRWVNITCLSSRLTPFNPWSAEIFNLIFSHLKLCLATAIHNLK